MDKAAREQLLARYAKFQVRVTDDDWTRVEGIFHNYIEKAEIVLVFKHVNGQNENPHYHIYLINIEITEQGIRKYLKNYYKGSQFSVKTKAGTVHKEAISPYGAYQYGTNDSKDYMEELVLVDPVYTKGISEWLLRDYKEQAKGFYEREIERIKKLNEENTKPMLMYREKADNTWERLFEKYENLKRQNNNPKTYVAIKNWIELDYLNRCKPPPRANDINRYAKALYLIRNGMVSEEELIAFKIENKVSNE